MPINYKEYPANWHEISRRIRTERAQNRCEKCGLPNGFVICREESGTYRKLCRTEWDMIWSKVMAGGHNLSTACKEFGFTRVVLTVAHLNHIKDDVRDENLQALCQKCHLEMDMTRHIRNRRYGRMTRFINTDLFEGTKFAIKEGIV